MNKLTAQKIKSVAEFAHYAIGTGSSLKANKEHITSHTKIFAGYESQWAGVDRAEVLEAFEQAMDCNRKADFTRRLELLIETMQNIEIEIEREQARAAAPAPRPAEPVITEEHAAQIAFFGGNDYAARRAIVEAAHAEALALDRVYSVMHADFVDPAHRTEADAAAARADALEAIATAGDAVPVPAADISSIDIRTMHEPIEAEADQPYALKVVTRAYVARSIARALASYTKHHAKYTAQDRLWLADHNANHAHRNGVITSEEYAAIYHLCRAEGADPLKLIDAVRVALLTGRPVMPAVNAAAEAVA